MTEKKSRGGRRSDQPPAAKDSASDLTAELKTKRAEFVQTFFKKGAELTEELVKENERLRKIAGELEAENTKLRTQLAKDKAMRDLLEKIDQLETEKQTLLSNMHEQEAVTNRFSNRFSEIESELENFANLYVASYQLHSTLRLSVVLRHLKELLLQLVGARSLAFFVVDDAKRNLVAVATEGVDPRNVAPIALTDGERPSAHDASLAAATIERVFLTGIAQVTEGPIAGADASLPAACVPMRIEDDVVGVIVVFELLAQKKEFVPVDFELFKLLAAHAATALVAAQLYAKAGHRLPSLESLETER
jgi:GAF domain-containing protein